MEIKIVDYMVDPAYIKGIVDEFIYFKWNKRFNTCGTFEFQVLRTNRTDELLELNTLVYIDEDNTGIIETVMYSQDESGVEYTTCIGRESSCILERRRGFNIVDKLKLSIWYYQGELAYLLKALIMHNFSNSTQHGWFERRYFEKLQVDISGLSLSTEIYRAMSPLDSVYKIIESVCQEQGNIGFTTKYNITTNTFTVVFYPALDNQTRISKDNGNLREYRYTTSLQNCYTAAYGINTQGEVIAVDETESYYMGRLINEGSISLTNRIQTYYTNNLYKATESGVFVNLEVGEEEMPLQDWLYYADQQVREYLKQHKQIDTFDATLENVSLAVGDSVHIVVNDNLPPVDVIIYGTNTIYEGIRVDTTYIIGNPVMNIYNQVKLLSQ